MIASLFNLGGVLGGILIGPISDATGRKPAIYVSALSYLFGAMLCSLSSSIGLIALGRVIGGVGAGSAMMVVPVFLA